MPSAMACLMRWSLMMSASMTRYSSRSAIRAFSRALLPAPGGPAVTMAVRPPRRGLAWLRYQSMVSFWNRARPMSPRR